MIDENFIIRFTNGLYTDDKTSIPTYDEFRDMFSSGQLASKIWAVEKLNELNIVDNNSSIIVVGCWFGTLALMLKKKFPLTTVKMLDIDKRCIKFLQRLGEQPIECDMFEYMYTESIVVNTSCEHIENINAWLEFLKKDTIVVLQSNNFFNCDGHINCVNSLDEFKDKVNLSTYLLMDELKLPMYTRYMIIGKT